MVRRFAPALVPLRVLPRLFPRRPRDATSGVARATRSGNAVAAASATCTGTAALAADGLGAGAATCDCEQDWQYGRTQK